MVTCNVHDDYDDMIAQNEMIIDTALKAPYLMCDIPSPAIHGLEFLKTIIGDNMEYANSLMETVGSMDELATLIEYGCTNFQHAYEGVISLMSYRRRGCAISDDEQYLMLKCLFDHGVVPQSEDLLAVHALRRTIGKITVRDPRSKKQSIDLIIDYLDEIGDVYVSLLCHQPCGPWAKLLLTHVTARPRLVREHILLGHLSKICRTSPLPFGAGTIIKMLLPLCDQQHLTEVLELALSTDNGSAKYIEAHLSSHRNNDIIDWDIITEWMNT